MRAGQRIRSLARDPALEDVSSHHNDLVDRIALFIPVSWLLFSFNMLRPSTGRCPRSQTCPCCSSRSAQSIFMQETRRAFCGALACLILAVASLANGILVIPVGLLILAVNRRYARLVGWLVISAGCIAAYAYRYNVMSSQSRVQHSVLSTVIRARPLFVLAFIGNVAALPFRGIHYHVVVLLSVLLGLLLCGFFVALAMRGYYRRNPVVSYCVLYLLLTAIGVAGLRSDMGLVLSFSLRYRIYSALLLIFAWFAIVEEFSPEYGRFS